MTEPSAQRSAPNPEARMSGKKVVVWFGISGVAVIVATIVTFQLYGRPRFVANSRLREGKSNVVYLARSVMACGEKQSALPESSPKVPAQLSQVGAALYASTPADWSAPAFSCVEFQVKDPQAFQYEWERRSEASGVARARADFNGDGVAEATFEQEVACAKVDGKFHCGPGPFRDLAQ